MIVVMTGSNSFALHAEMHKIIDEFVRKHGNSIEWFDGNEITNADGVLDAVRSISFLEPRKLVIVRDFAQNKDIFGKIETIIEQTADTTDLLLIDPKSDKRTSMFTYLKNNTEIRKYDNLKPYELENWLKSEAKKQEINIGNGEIRFLIERVGQDQQLLSQELNKLALNNNIITKNQIEELVEPTPQSKVFDLLDALFAGNLGKAQDLYADQKSQGEDPYKIESMIVWQLQQLTYAVYSPNQSIEDLTNAGISPYSAQKVHNMAKRISKADIKYFINELAEIDALSKTNADIESALAVYFSEVAGRLN
jgi:DNA polymerase-3 subunit delta